MKLGSKQDCDEAHFRSFFKVKAVRDKKRLQFAAGLPSARWPGARRARRAGGVTAELLAMPSGRKMRACSSSS